MNTAIINMPNDIELKSIKKPPKASGLGLINGFINRVYHKLGKNNIGVKIVFGKNSTKHGKNCNIYVIKL